jgi:hypothetical protein
MVPIGFILIGPDVSAGNTKNVRIVVMKNLLPSGLELNHKFDLKGSTYGRKASKKEREKAHPTFKVRSSYQSCGAQLKVRPEELHLRQEGQQEGEGEGHPHLQVKE